MNFEPSRNFAIEKLNNFIEDFEKFTQEMSPTVKSTQNELLQLYY